MAGPERVAVRASIAEAPAPPAATQRLPVRAHEKDAREAYLRFCLRLFGDLARPSAPKANKLRHALEQAHLDLLPEAYLAFVWTNSLVTAIVGYALVLTVLSAFAAAGAALPLAVVAVALVLPIFFTGTAYVAQVVYPDYRAGERRRAIDRELPYAVNFIAAMSSAGVVPAVLLRDLAREKAYGEVSKEVSWLVRDIDLLGIDLLTAIQRATGRTPSRKFQEFLQGAKTTILSGGDLKTYFLSKADQYMNDNRRTQREFIESLGLMAESYVTVVIAGPLFMLVMLSIMLLIGNSSASSEAFLFMLTFIMLPLAHTVFAWVIKNMAPEA
ncbi:MAG TPA: type II secretion system F family protein [Candidatus Thermoplasmatota archaeon]|nr:type II secretion system F family protein [Candidatus Thermoplasmatota archaeon]